MCIRCPIHRSPCCNPHTNGTPLPSTIFESTSNKYLCLFPKNDARPAAIVGVKTTSPAVEIDLRTSHVANANTSTGPGPRKIQDISGNPAQNTKCFRCSVLDRKCYWQTVGRDKGPCKRCIREAISEFGMDASKISLSVEEIVNTPHGQLGPR